MNINFYGNLKEGTLDIARGSYEKDGQEFDFEFDLTCRELVSVYDAQGNEVDIDKSVEKALNEELENLDEYDFKIEIEEIESYICPNDPDCIICNGKANGALFEAHYYRNDPDFESFNIYGVGEPNMYGRSSLLSLDEKFIQTNLFSDISVECENTACEASKMELDAIQEALEDAGYSIQVNNDYILIENWTDVGEDVPIEIEFDMYRAGLDISDYMDNLAYNFDIDEYAEPFVEMRGTHGIPSSISAIMDSAKEVGEMYEEIKDIVNKVMYNLHELEKPALDEQITIAEYVASAQEALNNKETSKDELEM